MSVFQGFRASALQNKRSDKEAAEEHQMCLVPRDCVLTNGHSWAKKVQSAQRLFHRHEVHIRRLEHMPAFPGLRMQAQEAPQSSGSGLISEPQLQRRALAQKNKVDRGKGRNRCSPLLSTSVHTNMSYTPTQK